MADTSASSEQLLINAAALDKLEDHTQLVGGRRKRHEEEDDEDKDAPKHRPATKQARRHSWQPKYEVEFGLLAIERDAASGDVLLAICGFCKVFGREGKYEQLVQQDQETGNDAKKRRRRSLTTTKFFRAFRVDNIRSHLQGAHPRRWAEYEVLPKQDAVRARYLQGELQPYDHLPIVDDVVLTTSELTAECGMPYDQNQVLSQASAISEAQHAVAQATAQTEAVQPSTAVNGGGHCTTHMTASLTFSASGAPSSAALASSSVRSTFDYEKHLTEQITLDRERLEFEKARFKKEVELRERELALREKHMEQKSALQEQLCKAYREHAQLENAKFYRLAEVLRDAITGAQSSSETASIV